MKFRLIIFLLANLALVSFKDPVKTSSADIVVYGETASGVIAAIQAARMGKDVILLSSNHHVGGVMTSGLTATDINKYQEVGGVSREVFQRVYSYYLNKKNWHRQDRDDFFEMSKKRTFTGKNDSLKMQWVYESHVLEDIYKDMLRESGVKVVYNQKLDLNKGVVKEESSIKSIRMVDGNVYQAKVFIDATYEGDLMARAGVSYFVGRESNKQYNELRAGVRIDPDGSSIDPYVIKGDPSSGLLPFIEPFSERIAGSADKKVQAYTYRVTLTSDRKNRKPIKKPENYNPLWYEHLARRGSSPQSTLTGYITITPMPNKKTDTNHLDFVGASYDWAEADYETREKIARMHREYAHGLLWFLGNDTRIPESVRAEMKQWGFPKDEFTDNGNFPYQLYVREARRMVSDFVMTEANCRAQNRIDAPSSVGLGTYAFDSHYVARVLDQDGKVKIDGSFFGVASIYPISYLSIIPKKEECSNLIVPICMSASHVAYSSIRMEPVYMVLGQSAGTAAALSINRNTSVQDLPYAALRAQLIADKQVLDPKPAIQKIAK